MKAFIFRVFLVIIITVLFIDLNSVQMTVSINQLESGDLETLFNPLDTNKPEYGDWVVLHEQNDPEKLNPLLTSDAITYEICNYIFDRMLVIDKETYKLKPSVAKELPIISKDKLSYTFELRDDVLFSDGHPLTGEDIIFTLKVIKNPFINAQSKRNYLYDVKCAELIDGNKCKVRFKMYKPYYGAVYSISDLEILPKHILDKDEVIDKFTFEELNNVSSTSDLEKFSMIKKFADFINSQEVSRSPKYVIGSGPYKFEEWLPLQTITLIRNDNYWNKDIPNYPDKIIFKVIQDQTYALVTAMNGEIDCMSVIWTKDFVKNLENPEKHGLKKAVVGRPIYAYIAWNEERPFFADKKVRMALSHCIDRQSIIDNLLYGFAVPIQSHVYYKSEFINKDLPTIPYDIEKAKQLLLEAGWEDTDGNGILDKIIDGKRVDFKFTFVNNQNPVRRLITLEIIKSLKKIGIEADIQDFEWPIFLDKLYKHDYDASYGGWVLSDAPPDPFQIFHSSQSSDEGSNYISYKNLESDKILEELRTEFDENKRKELLYKWQEIIYKDQPYTFLWSSYGKYIYSDRFNNVKFYHHPYPFKCNEWWTPKSKQKYK